MIPQSVREAVKRRADGLCEYCHRGPDFRKMHFAHLKSKGSFGPDTEENIQYWCARCHLDDWHGGKRKEMERRLGIE